jgi:PPK2 family polyphosphate:nucleotide phosphotransferase
MVASEGAPVVLDGFPTGSTELVADRRQAERRFDSVLLPALADLHDRLMASQQHSLLIVLQGLDGSGKSGTVKHIAKGLNANALRCASFKEPDAAERREPFLARIRLQLPEPGQVVFFDRSHYEDAIVPLAAGELDRRQLTKRLAQIREFEEGLVERGTLVLKCLLHIGYDEQRQRFLRRLQRPDKQWKFKLSDLETRLAWPEMQAAIGEVVGRTSTPAAPWHIIPADHKWYRNWLVASLMVEQLEQLELDYPPLAPGIEPDDVRRRLAAPR